ncbi:hypothetical protein Hte_010145 [Hypoxylon texense]
MSFAVHNANEEYRSMVEAYLKSRARKFKQPLFTKDDDDTMKAVVKRGPPIDTTPTPELLDSLKDVTYTSIWDRAAENMDYLKRQLTHQIPRHQEEGKERAIKLRDCRITIETGFKEAEKEIRASFLDPDLICNGIHEKIEMLRKFEKVYPISVNSPPPTPFKSQTSILILVVLVFVMFSLIPISVAWIKSTSDCGSVEDSDFWMLIPNAMCQILSLLTSVYMIGHRTPEDSTAWKCALLFTGVGIICSIISIPLYLLVATMWSSTISFCAATAQFGAMLEIAIIMENPKSKQD